MIKLLSIFTNVFILGALLIGLLLFSVDRAFAFDLFSGSKVKLVDNEETYLLYENDDEFLVLKSFRVVATFDPVKLKATKIFSVHPTMKPILKKQNFIDQNALKKWLESVFPDYQCLTVHGVQKCKK